MPLRIAAATEADTALVLSFVRKLADYEKLSHEVVATEDLLRENLFGERPVAEAVIAWVDGKPAGFAVFFLTISTYLARPGLYLEDLFVDPEYRGRGIGKALLVHLAKLAGERGCARFEWSALKWNEPAIGFYKKLGAEAMDQWTIFRVSGPQLERLANQDQD
jgi:GNAT superfamily N-acetyltransferase